MKFITTTLIVLSSAYYAAAGDCSCGPDEDAGSFKCGNNVYVCPDVTEMCKTQGSRKSKYYAVTPEECEGLKKLKLTEKCPLIDRYPVIESRGLSNRVCYSEVNDVFTGFKTDDRGCAECNEVVPIPFEPGYEPEAPAVVEDPPADVEDPPADAEDPPADVQDPPADSRDPTPPADGRDPAPEVTAETPQPPICEGDVAVINTNGVTEITGTDAVEIISQDTSTVTVSLKNAWTIAAEDEIDAIYYQYQVDTFDERCFPNTNVPGGSSYDEITLTCYDTKPFAELTICVADSGGALDSLDGAQVPKCCHANLENGTPVVCYTIAVNCESSCDETPIRRALRGAATN